jgi:hypothetical protein
MKNQLQWLGFMLVFIVLISGSLACATMAASAASKNNGSTIKTLALSDEIIAIGRPDAELSKKLNNEHAVAFLGKNNTYMLFKGGEELESISKLKLDPKRLDIDATTNKNLYLGNKQVWGNLRLTYGDSKGYSDEERTILDHAGFKPFKGSIYKFYYKNIYLQGLVYPAIKLSETQQSQLTVHRPFNLYKTDHTESTFNPAGIVLIPLGVATDIVLAPVYLGVGVVVLVVAAVSH